MAYAICIQYCRYLLELLAMMTKTHVLDWCDAAFIYEIHSSFLVSACTKNDENTSTPKAMDNYCYNVILSETSFVEVFIYSLLDACLSKWMVLGALIHSKGLMVPEDWKIPEEVDEWSKVPNTDLVYSSFFSLDKLN